MSPLILVVALAITIASVVSSRRHFESTEEYTLARNSLTPSTMVFTLFATGMGVWVLFGPAEALLTAGAVALFCYALSSSLSLFIFAWLGDKMRKAYPNGRSLIEFVQERVGTPMYLLVLSVSFLYMSIALAAGLSGMGLAAEIVLDVSPAGAVLVVGLATLMYMAVGGFRATIVAGKIQTFIILPLFATLVVASLSIMGGVSSSWIASSVPAFGWFGIEYGLALIIGVLAAEAFNQVWWQHVYSAKDMRAVRRGFFITGTIMFPIVNLAGFLGIYAASAGVVGNATAAVFDFVNTLPSWLTTLTMVMTIALVMGNMDNLLNGMVSIVAIDVKRLRPGISEQTLLRLAKVLTAVFALGSIAVATNGYSVLYLFLLADVICAGAVFSVFYGLYSQRVRKHVAFVACLMGIGIGLLLFPDPAFTRGNLLGSFLVALIVPAIITLLFREKLPQPASVIS